MGTNICKQRDEVNKKRTKNLIRHYLWYANSVSLDVRTLVIVILTKEVRRAQLQKNKADDIKSLNEDFLLL